MTGKDLAKGGIVKPRNQFVVEGNPIGSIIIGDQAEQFRGSLGTVQTTIVISNEFETTKHIKIPFDYKNGDPVGVIRDILEKQMGLKLSKDELARISNICDEVVENYI